MGSSGIRIPAGAEERAIQQVEAVSWVADYLINAHVAQDVLYVHVGDGDSDHSYWLRPEDMTTPMSLLEIPPCITVHAWGRAGTGHPSFYGCMDADEGDAQA